MSPCLCSFWTFFPECLCFILNQIPCSHSISLVLMASSKSLPSINLLHTCYTILSRCLYMCLPVSFPWTDMVPYLKALTHSTMYRISGTLKKRGDTLISCWNKLSSGVLKATFSKILGLTGFWEEYEPLAIYFLNADLPQFWKSDLSFLWKRLQVSNFISGSFVKQLK